MEKNSIVAIRELIRAMLPGFETYLVLDEEDVLSIIISHNGRHIDTLIYQIVDYKVDALDIWHMMETFTKITQKPVPEEEHNATIVMLEIAFNAISKDDKRKIKIVEKQDCIIIIERGYGLDEIDCIIDEIDCIIDEIDIASTAIKESTKRVIDCIKPCDNAADLVKYVHTLYNILPKRINDAMSSHQYIKAASMAIEYNLAQKLEEIMNNEYD